MSLKFSLSDRHKVRYHLNMALIRSAQLQENHQAYAGEFYRYDAVLSPTEYQASRPAPLLFTQEEIWKRLDKAENEAGFMVEKILEILTLLDRIEKTLNEERLDTNYALVQTDKLIWNQPERTSGLLIQQGDAIEKLRYFLELPPTVLPQSGQSYRS